MAIELKIPSVGESITEVMVGEWLISEGEWVDEDEPVAIIETDKVNVELTAPEPGVLKEILKQEGDDAEVGEVVGYLEAQEKPEGEGKEKSEKSEKKSDESDKSDKSDKKSEKKGDKEPSKKVEDGKRVMPAARRLLEEKDLEPSEVEATGPGGRLLKEDVIRHLDRREKREEGKGEEKEAKKERREKKAEREEPREEPAPKVTGPRQEEAVKMTPLRRRVAERLVEAQQNAALLTTFNEIDMSRVIALRKQYQDEFRDKYGIKLGFMSFFVKAAVEALKEIPRVNAEIRGEEIIYRNYQDIGIAVGGGKGLVVPVIRNAERLSFAEVEKTIADYAQRAQDGKLKLEELQGGTFTISNGGIYGSLLSTPIINPPQSGILGMHKFQDRPVAVGGEVVIRPMMYVALTYDHRLVDGREAVTFLLRIKERIEDPTRILLEV